MNSKGLEGFMHGTALAANLSEGQPNVVPPGKFLSGYGECYGDYAYSKTLMIHNQDLPAVKMLSETVHGEVDLELESLAVS